jgi:hypothetical protein
VTAAACRVAAGRVAAAKVAAVKHVAAKAVAAKATAKVPARIVFTAAVDMAVDVAVHTPVGEAPCRRVPPRSCLAAGSALVVVARAPLARAGAGPTIDRAVNIRVVVNGDGLSRPPVLDDVHVVRLRGQIPGRRRRASRRPSVDSFPPGPASAAA